MSKQSVLFIVGQHDKLSNGKPTGYYLPEAAHPYYEVGKHHNVEFASIKGGKAVLDPASVESSKDDELSQKFLKDDAAQKGVTSTLKIADVDASKYAAIFVVGGHAPVFESKDPSLVKLLTEFWNSGKLVSAVCHGPAALVEVKDKNGKSIFEGRKATGFTNAEEEQAGLTDAVPWLLESRIKELGGKFESADKPWGAHVVQDGQLLTGQNPASASGVGEAIVKHLQSKA